MTLVRSLLHPFERTPDLRGPDRRGVVVCSYRIIIISRGSGRCARVADFASADGDRRAGFASADSGMTFVSAPIRQPGYLGRLVLLLLVRLVMRIL